MSGGGDTALPKPRLLEDLSHQLSSLLGSCPWMLPEGRKILKQLRSPFHVGHHVWLWHRGQRLPLTFQCLELFFESIVIDGRPEVLFPEIGYGTLDTLCFKSMVWSRSLVDHRPKYGVSPTVVQLDAVQDSFCKFLLN